MTAEGQQAHAVGSGLIGQGSAGANRPADGDSDDARRTARPPENSPPRGRLPLDGGADAPVRLCLCDKLPAVLLG
jgi:hypothetical protein